MSRRTKWMACAGLLLLAACGGDPPRTGLVLDKTFQAAYVEVGVIASCVGNPPVCVPIPYETHHPNRWHLFLENCDRAKKNGEPACFKGYREVPRETYERVAVGEHYGGGDGR